MNRGGKKAAVWLSVCITAGILLCGCREKELTKTVLLPDKKQDKSEQMGIAIKNIQEYTYDGSVMDQNGWGFLCWNKNGSLGLLKLEEDSYVYQSIDMDNGEIVRQVPVGESYRNMSHVMVAPGGEYISYEVMTGGIVQLLLLHVETGEEEVLHKWDDLSLLYQYIWSSDGKSLFAWEDGCNYDQDAGLGDWHIYCYRLDGGLQRKTIIPMAGNGYAWRHVLPDGDGSRVFVREEYIDEDGNAEVGTGTEDAGERYEGNLGSTEKRGDTAFMNCLLELDAENRYYIQNMPADISSLVKYTREGLFYWNTEGMLYQVTSLLEEPVRRELLDVETSGICICSEGDHVFLYEQTGYTEYMQISGIQLKDRAVLGPRILYKDKGGDITQMIVSADDHRVAVQTCEYIGQEQASYKITVLEY